jgi:hypothetical protein
VSAFLDRPLRRRWKTGPAAGSAGPFLCSLTQFKPHHVRDLAAIWAAAERLSGELIEIEGACGVLTYFRPRHFFVGSLSAWTGKAALSRFVSLPYHREIMCRYRSRGLPLRSAKWWTEGLQVDAALAEGLRLLEQSGARS